MSVYLNLTISFDEGNADFHLSEQKVKISDTNYDSECDEIVYYEGSLPLLLKEICFDMDKDSAINRSSDSLPDITAGDWMKVQGLLLQKIYNSLNDSHAHYWRMKADHPQLYMALLERVIFYTQYQVNDEFTDFELARKFIIDALGIIK